MCSTDQRVDAEAATRTCAYPRLSRPEHSGRWQLTLASSVDHADDLGRQLAAGLELGVELLGPQHLHPSSCEAATEQWPVRFAEAQHASHLHLGVEKSAHRHPPRRRRWRSPRCGRCSRWFPGSAGHAAAAPWAKRDRPSPCRASPPERTGGPRRRGQGLVRDSKDEAAELWVLCPDALLTSRRAPLELPTCGCPGRSRLDHLGLRGVAERHSVRRRDGIHRMADAANGRGRPFVDRLVRCRRVRSGLPA